VHQTIAAEKHVCTWKFIPRKINERKAPRFTRMQALVLLNDRGNYVAANVLDATQVNVPHPGKVAARHVEQHARFQLTKRDGQFGSQYAR
jgi:hypothetical protein